MRVILTSLSKSLQKGKRSAKTAFFLHAGSFLHEMRFLRFFRVCVRGRFCAVKRTDKSKTFATFGKGAGCCVGAGGTGGVFGKRAIGAARVPAVCVCACRKICKKCFFYVFFVRIINLCFVYLFALGYKNIGIGVLKCVNLC